MKRNGFRRTMENEKNNINEPKIKKETTQMERFDRKRFNVLHLLNDLNRNLIGKYKV